MADYFEYDKDNILNKPEYLADCMIDDQQELAKKLSAELEENEKQIDKIHSSLSVEKLKYDRIKLEEAVLDEKIAEVERLKALYGRAEVLLKLDDADLEMFIKRRQDLLKRKSAMIESIKEKEQFEQKLLAKKQDLENKISLSEAKISTKRFNLPESNRTKEAVEIANRTTYKRFPYPDTIAQINRDQFMALWDKIWNRLSVDKSNIYAEIDIVEVTEKDIALGKILSMDGRIYREIDVVPFGENENDKAITNVKNNDFYVKITDGENVGYSSRKKFLFDLQSIFAPLNAEREFLDSEPDVRLLSELVVTIPKIVKNLPLYIFNSTRLVTILENSLVLASAKLQKDDKYWGYDKSVVENYINETTLAFNERKQKARELRMKR